MDRFAAPCRSDGSRDSLGRQHRHPGLGLAARVRRGCRSSCGNGSRLPSLLRLSILLLVLLSHTALAETRAWLDRDRIGFGETATLNIETDQAAVDSPEYGPLLGDFEISGNTSSRQFEDANGTVRTRVLFAVALRPRREGAVPVPALQVGAERTAPLTLTVSPAAPAPASSRAGDPVFIEAQADAASPYVQQAVGYIVRLYYATSLISGQLDQDAPEGATLQRVGEDVRYQRDVGGRRYTVVERRYLLIPERSGTLRIPGARFRGQGMGGFFDELFGDGRRELAARGPVQSLRVRPLPADAPRPWLPLRGLELAYLDTPTEARAGEAATVIVELRADGANATQLPELTLPVPQDAQVFADTAQVDEGFDRGRPQVRIVRRFSVVPSKAGALRIAGPRLQWWDVEAGRTRTTDLPELRLRVSPGAASQQPPATTPPSRQEGAPQRWIEVPFVQGAVHAWALATVAFALLWLATLWWGLHRRPQAEGAEDAATVSGTGRGSVASLKQALSGGDLIAIGSALQQAPSPSLHGLDAVVDALDDDAQRAAVRALQQVRWGEGDAAAALAALRSAFRHGARWKRATRSGKPLLPPLYPRS